MGARCELMREHIVGSLKELKEQSDFLVGVIGTVRERSATLEHDINHWVEAFVAVEFTQDEKAIELRDREHAVEIRERSVSQVRTTAADRLAEIETLKSQLARLNAQYKNCLEERNAARAEAGNLAAAISRALGSGEIKVIGATETEAQRP